MKTLASKKTMFAFVTALMVFSFFSCKGNPPPKETAIAPENRTADWIADRHIVLRTFDVDIGLESPDDSINNAVAQEIKRRTGITMEIQYTSGIGSLEALTTAIVSGDLPDVIYHYLNNSTRPEYPIVLKASREGVLQDIAPYLRKGKTYSKYYEDGWLPADTYNNIIQRKEFDGATYDVHMRINREDDIKTVEIRGGMYIQKSIVDALGINPWEIETQEDLKNLLIQIKESDTTDAYGNPIIPLGPAYWGGGLRRYPFEAYYVGGSSWEYTDGKVLYITQTEYLQGLVTYARELLDENLIHKEFFTMDGARAKEAALSYSFAIIEDVHSGVTDLFEKAEYVPLGSMVDKYGNYDKYTVGKSGYSAWAIPSTTENPEEIVAFADFLASYEGKLLWQYGIEGLHYDMVDGKPYPKQEVIDTAKTNPDYLRNENIWAGGQGSAWGTVFGRTDMDTYTDFGERLWGENTMPDMFTEREELNNYGLTERPYDKTIFIEGFTPGHYANVWAEEEGGSDELAALIDFEFYEDIVVQAIYSSTDEQAKAIIADYAMQLERVGLLEFEVYLENIIAQDPTLVNINTGN